MEENKVDVVEESTTYDEEKLKDTLGKVEDARLAFRKYYKITEVFKYLTLALCIAMLLISFLAFNNVPNSQYFMFGGAGIALLLLALYTFVATSLKKKRMKKYFQEFYSYYNAYTYGDYKCEILDEKIELLEFTSSNLYSDVYAAPSRNVMFLDYNGEKIKCAEIAAQVKGSKQLKSVFVGKILISKNNYDSDDGVYIYFNASDEKLALPPTTVSNYAEVLKTDKYTIYSNNPNWKKAISKTVKDQLSRLNMDKTVIDGSISIQKGKTYFLLGIDDALMVLPYEKKFEYGPSISFKNHLDIVLDIISSINK